MRGNRYLAGFTYLGLLLFIAIAGIGLAAVGQSWHTEMKREKEAELLFIGDQFRRAIGSYYESTPSGPKQYPATLEELVRDMRAPKARHHLRRIYADPMTGRAEWGLVKQDGRIVGVYSLLQQKPLKAAGFDPQYDSFSGAKNYSDWRFAYGESETGAGNAGASVPKPAVPGISASPLTTLLPVPTTPAPIAAPMPPQQNSQQQDCLDQRISDLAACNSLCQGGGLCNRCRMSASMRFNACMTGSAIPTLASGD